MISMKSNSHSSSLDYAIQSVTKKFSNEWRLLTVMNKRKDTLYSGIMQKKKTTVGVLAPIVINLVSKLIESGSFSDQCGLKIHWTGKLSGTINILASFYL